MIARVCLLLALGDVAWAAAGAQEPCPIGTFFEPYSRVCAPVNDVRNVFVPPAAEPSAKTVPHQTAVRASQQGASELESEFTDAPEPGYIIAGIRYRTGALSVTRVSRLDTRMFVYPDGVQPQGALNWLYTPATNHTISAVEVVGIYRSAQGDRGVIGLFGRGCSETFPCPNGSTTSAWQYFRDFFDLACNLTHIVDDGGHAQKALHYANVTERLDDGAPPLWKSAVYFWNYCAQAWDLTWAHEYREAKEDCAITGCAWWGPGYEIFGEDPYPPVMELGYEDSLLYHDGVWSELTAR